MKIETIKVKKLHKDAKLPYRQYEGDACYDLYAVEDVHIKGDEVKKVHFGISWELPKGYEGVVRSRSSSFAKKGLNVYVGTVDQQYRGEIVCLVSLINPHPCQDGDAWFINHATISKGESIAQVAFRRVPQFDIVEVEELDDTERGDGGFGSTG